MNVMKGKILFVVNLRNSNGDPIYTKIKQELVGGGYSGVALKVAHGVWFNGGHNTVDVDEFANRIKGLVNFYGWHWNILADPEAEAVRAVEAINRWGLDGYMLDYEAPAKEAGKNAQIEFCKEFRERMPDFPLGLLSYRYPSYHPEIDWERVLEYCDFHAPQVYWMKAHDPANQLQKSYNELMAIKELPFIPVGAAFEEHGWKPTGAEIQAFDQRAKKMKLPGVQWFSYRGAKPLGLLPTLAGLAWDVVKPDPTPVADCEKAIKEAVLDCTIKYDLIIDEIKELHQKELVEAIKKANNDALNNLIKPYLM